MRNHFKFKLSDKINNSEESKEIEFTADKVDDDTYQVYWGYGESRQCAYYSPSVIEEYLDEGSWIEVD